MTRYAVVNACVDFRDIRQVFVVTNNMDVVADEENANMKAARERAEQEQKEIERHSSSVDRDNKERFRNILSRKRHMDQRKDRSRGRMGQTHLEAEWRCIRMAANRKRESPAERGRSGKVKKIL